MGSIDEFFRYFPNRYRVPQSLMRVRASCNQCDCTKRAKAEAAPNVSSRTRISVEIVMRPPYLSPALSTGEQINGRRLGTARPFPLWRLHSGPQSSSVDQYSETPPEHLALTITEACADRWLPITAVELKIYSMTGVIWLDRPTLCCVTRLA